MKYTPYYGVRLFRNSDWYSQSELSMQRYAVRCGIAVPLYDKTSKLRTGKIVLGHGLGAEVARVRRSARWLLAIGMNGTDYRKLN